MSEKKEKKRVAHFRFLLFHLCEGKVKVKKKRQEKNDGR